MFCSRTVSSSARLSARAANFSVRSSANDWSGSCALSGPPAARPALLNPIPDCFHRLDFLGDGVERLFDRKQQAIGHVDRRGPGFHLDEQDVLTLDQNLAAFI